MKAIENNDSYQTYATSKIYNIPKEILYEIINIVLVEVSRNMGNEFNDKMMDAIIGTIEENHYGLPLCYIVSALYNGSMGIYGAGRLIPRTIYSWLRETSQEYQKELEHKKLEERLKSNSTPIDLKKYLVGTALNLKIEWLMSKMITPDQWDIIELKQLAKMIGEGRIPRPKDFGIKLIKTE